MQSCSSRTKDVIPVDVSTGSVGLGVAITTFASLVQPGHQVIGAHTADNPERYCQSKRQSKEGKYVP